MRISDWSSDVCSSDLAPTHKLTQPWKFTVFTGEGLIKLADELKKQYKKSVSKDDYSKKKGESIREKVLQSGAVIAICLSESGKIPKWEELAAVASAVQRSEEHTSELQSLMRISYAVFCL